MLDPFIPLARNCPNLIAREVENMRSTWTVWWKPAVSRSPTICPGRIPWSLVQPLSTLVEVCYLWFTNYPSFAEKLGVWDEGLYPCKAGSKMLKSFLKSSASPIPGISPCSLGTHLLTSRVNILSFPMKFIGYSLFIPHGIYFTFSKSLQRREVLILLPIWNHLSQSPLKAEQDCGALWGPEALCVPHFLFLGKMLSDS